MKYILIPFVIGAYIYVSNQDFKDQSRIEEYGQVQSIQSL